jgi:hypothetical protein
MQLNALQQNVRRNIVEHLQLLGSVNQQLEYQRRVPFVNVTAELVCSWFDDLYAPDDEIFLAAFSSKELEVMAQFDRAFEKLLANIPPEGIPPIDVLALMPEWERLTQMARIALDDFYAQKADVS